MNRAIFLDRDGVLNDALVLEGKPYPPSSLEEFRIAEGVVAACEALRGSGFALVVVTNQPDVARGKTTNAQVEEFHEVIQSKLGIQHFYTCFHDDSDACFCRKPSPGLILQAANSLNLDIGSSYMIGDRWRDIEAGNEAGCKTIFIDHAYDEKQPQDYYLKVGSLLEASSFILGEAP